MITFFTIVSFYYEDNVGVNMFIISGAGHWMVSDDITDINGWLTSEEQGLLTPPWTGWRYSEYSSGFWISDMTLQLIF